MDLKSVHPTDGATALSDEQDLLEEIQSDLLPDFTILLQFEYRVPES